ncbi:hypothetical protein MIND_00538500 [Mycena indigotica]|uniref:Uncharacterized protein n=1 Tax=Mycena indigotica TaxID=2126181 RepID=A0A8H6W8Y3_9AGAR|nr:uncharacterized protein MIND_00538500 [Mycena indigotica]KAF7307441.1 hypothetical protein MIND_00538500 [Mycena indigotica]
MKKRWDGHEFRDMFLGSQPTPHRANAATKSPGTSNPASGYILTTTGVVPAPPKRGFARAGPVVWAASMFFCWLGRNRGQAPNDPNYGIAMAGISGSTREAGVVAKPVPSEPFAGAEVDGELATLARSGSLRPLQRIRRFSQRKRESGKCCANPNNSLRWRFANGAAEKRHVCSFRMETYCESNYNFDLLINLCQ